MPLKEDHMLAFIAAALFGLALLLDFFDIKAGDALTNTTLTTAGLLCLALHLAGVGTASRRFSRSRR
jgi:hypothetical protein